MSSFRRWYVYVVAAVSLQAVAWATITLLRNLLYTALPGVPATAVAGPERIAFQIAVILIGTPVYLLHIRRAGDGENSDGPASATAAQRLYLTLMLALFLIPLLTNTVGLLQAALRLLSGTPPTHFLFDSTVPDTAALAGSAAALIVLALFSGYHARQLRLLDTSRAGGPPPLRRLFDYGFSAGTLAFASGAAAALLAALFSTESRAPLAVDRRLINNLAVLLVAGTTWLLFWGNIQRRLRRGGSGERGHRARPFYLYAVILLAILSTAGAAAALVATLLRRLLDLPPVGGSGLVLATLIVAVSVWAYHALVLREDAGAAPDQSQRSAVGRLYRYLVAGVGLLALLAGLGGLLSLLFDRGPYLISEQREQLAWFTAVLFTGLLLWILPWRALDRELAAPAPVGPEARRSPLRRFYLYFFLLLATLTALLTAIFILSRLLIRLLGRPPGPGDGYDLALAAAYFVVAAAVWIYHGLLLRADSAALAALKSQRVANISLLVFDDGDGRLARLLARSVSQALPGLQVVTAGLTPGANEALYGASEPPPLPAIASADLIAGPWSMAAPHAGLTADESVLAAIAASPAHKIILPRPAPGWQWAGVPEWDEQTAVRDATAAVEQYVAADLADADAPPGPALILLLIAATIAIFALLASLLDSVLPLF